jgi:hypothetical protein
MEPQNAALPLFQELDGESPGSRGSLPFVFNGLARSSIIELFEHKADTCLDVLRTTQRFDCAGILLTSPQRPDRKPVSMSAPRARPLVWRIPARRTTITGHRSPAIEKRIFTSARSPSVSSKSCSGLIQIRRNGQYLSVSSEALSLFIFSPTCGPIVFS